ncbi:hypothetical protein AAII07_30565 [Microvirga sp. 0TCS3.31]
MGGLDQGHELARQHAATEGEEFGDQDVGPGDAQRVEQDRLSLSEIGLVDRLKFFVEERLEIGPNGADGWQLKQLCPAEIGQTGRGSARHESRFMPFVGEGTRQGCGPREMACAQKMCHGDENAQCHAPTPAVSGSSAWRKRKAA